MVDLDEFVNGCLNLHGPAKSLQPWPRNASKTFADFSVLHLAIPRLSLRTRLARMSFENKLTRREIKSLKMAASWLHWAADWELQ